MNVMRVARFQYLAVIAAAMVSVAPCGAHAQESAAPAESAQKSAAPTEPASAAGEIEVLVTAGRGLEQDPLDVPQSTSVIDRAELDAQEFTDVDDAIRREVGVGLAPAEGNPNYWQEGFTLRGLGAQRVLTLTDGVRQAGQGIGYGGGNLSLYDTYGIERIEIVRGPASVLYGTDAFGGVINVITREPEVRTEWGHNGGAKYSFDGARDAHRFGAYLDVGDERWGAVVSGGYLDADEPNLPDDVDPNGGSFENYGFSGKFDFRVTDDTTVRVIGNMDRNRDVLITDETIDLPIAVFGRPGSSQIISSPLYFEFPEYNRSLLGAEVVTEDLSDRLEYLKTGVYWQQISREFRRETAFYPSFSPGFAGPPTFIDPTATVETSRVDTDDEVNTIEWQTQGRLDFGSHLVTTGLDLGYDESDLPETETQTIVAVAGPGAIRGIPPTVIERKRADAEQIRLGIYAQDNWAVGEKFEVIPGIRADYYGVDDTVSDYDDDEYGLSGSLGAVYRPEQEQSVYTTLASGFRAPDLGERFQSGVVNLGVPSQIIGKADLDPERAWTAEVGTKSEYDRWSYTFAGYINFIEDYIGTSDIGLVNGFATEQYDNLGDVTMYGTELGGAYNITDAWEVYANAYRTWTDDEDKVDVADWTFNYGTAYTFPVTSSVITNISAALNARSVLKSEDKTPTSGGREEFNGGSFTVVDLALNADLFENEFGRVKIISALRNIFDRSYEEPFFPELQPGRNAYVGIQVDY